MTAAVFLAGLMSPNEVWEGSVTVTSCSIRFTKRHRVVTNHDAYLLEFSDVVVQSGCRETSWDGGFAKRNDRL